MKMEKIGIRNYINNISHTFFLSWSLSTEFKNRFWNRFSKVIMERRSDSNTLQVKMYRLYNLRLNKFC